MILFLIVREETTRRMNERSKIIKSKVESKNQSCICGMWFNFVACVV